MQCRRRRRCHAAEINACHAIRLPSKPCAEGKAIMITVPELAADALGTFLASYMQRRYGRAETRLVELVSSIARIALECIGKSDALYHNVEHTMLVTLAGHDILRGRALHAHMPPEDYAHLIIACVTHDIGYVRGIFVQDDEDGVLIDAAGRKAKLPRGASDVALLAHHVDRSKLYIMERIHGIAELDAERIARAVEGSRFRPQPPARLRQPRRYRPQIPAVLLEQRGAIHSIRPSLSQRHGERPAMDCQSLLQCFSRRTRHCTRGTAEMMSI